MHLSARSFCRENGFFIFVVPVAVIVSHNAPPLIRVLFAVFYYLSAKTRLRRQSDEESKKNTADKPPLAYTDCQCRHDSRKTNISQLYAVHFGSFPPALSLNSQNASALFPQVLQCVFISIHFIKISRKRSCQSTDRMYTEFGYQDFLSAPCETNVSYNGFLRRATILKCAETKKAPLSRQIIHLSIFCLSVNFKYINRMRRFPPHRLKITQELFSFR